MLSFFGLLMTFSPLRRSIYNLRIFAGRSYPTGHPLAN
jgi:hypothetical protein